LRLLYINHTSRTSGAEQSLLTLLAHLPSEIEAAIACPEGPLADAARDLGVPVLAMRGTDVSLKLHPTRTPSALASMLLAARELRGAAGAFEPDLVHANSVRAGLIAALAWPRAGPPVAVHLHDRLPAGLLPRLTMGVITRTASTILACSDFTAAQLAGMRSGPPLIVVHNPVRLDAFRPRPDRRAALRQELGIGDDLPVVAVVAQITPWKGQDDAIRALAAVIRRGREARLLLVGSPKFTSKTTRYDNESYLQELRRLVAELGVEREVLFLGERGDISDLLNAVDVALVPSWEEPFGMAMIEAMSMQIPVIATSVGGTSEIMDARTGVLLPPREPQLWAREIERLIDDRQLRREMGERARERIREQLDAPVYVERVMRAYRGAVAPAPGA
jgi:L-malate glycosyltransferase